MTLRSRKYQLFRSGKLESAGMIYISHFDIYSIRWGMFKMLFLIFSVGLISSKAYTYPQFIGKGYHACLTCHYNPFGNGPLNDYGRGVAASGLAGRLFIGKKTTDEMLSNRSGFFFNAPNSKSIISPSLDYRGVSLNRNIADETSEDQWINMQMDASVSAEWGRQKQYIATFTYSVVPSNSLPSGNADYEVKAGEDLTFSREHYFGYKFTPSMGVYLGKMDKVFGIRIVDHTAASRRITRNSQYGATHGLVFHWGGEKFDFGLQSYIGDLQKIEESRTEGFASKIEYSVTDDTRLGISLLVDKDFNDNEKTAYALINKMRIGKGSSLLYEFGQVRTTQASDSTVTTEQYMLLQNHIYIMRGLYFMMTYQQYIDDTSGASEDHVLAPGIQYFPMQRVELRLDLQNRKSYQTEIASEDTWTTLGQLHLWF